MRMTAIMLVLLVAILVNTADPLPKAKIEMVTEETPATQEPDTYAAREAAALLLAEQAYRTSLDSEHMTEEDARQVAEIMYRETMKGTIRLPVNTLD